MRQKQDAYKKDDPIEKKEKELNRKASELIKAYETDREARSEWEEKYKKGLLKR